LASRSFIKVPYIAGKRPGRESPKTPPAASRSKKPARRGEKRSKTGQKCPFWGPNGLFSRIFGNFRGFWACAGFRDVVSCAVPIFRSNSGTEHLFAGASVGFRPRTWTRESPEPSNLSRVYMAKKTKKPAVAMDAERAKMMAMYEETLKTFTEGAIVKGTVVEMRPQEVLVNIGYKSEGLLPASEFKDLSEIHVGDEVEVLLERLEDEHGMVVLSKSRAEQQRNWDNVTASCEEGKVVSGVVRARSRAACWSTWAAWTRSCPARRSTWCRRATWTISWARPWNARSSRSTTSAATSCCRAAT
jgi:hypothetical protein